MTFNLQDAWNVETSTSSQRLDISAAVAAIQAKVHKPITMVVTALTEDLVIKAGDGTVEASDTLTSNKYVSGNYPVAADTVQEIAVGRGNTHVAFKAEGVGVVKIAVGYND